MSRASKCLKILSCLWGILLISFSAFFIIYQPHIDYIRTAMQKQFELIPGRMGYEEVWLKLDLYFRVYIFDVLNPDEVMKGAKPQLIERGPYVYDMFVDKEVLKIHEDIDELDYLTTRTFYFNKLLSNGTEDDVITVIHAAYMATMGTMAATFASFLSKLGNDIPKLFPGMDGVFLRGKVGDILFDGLPMECNVNKYKELKLICGFLKGKKPAIIKDTDIGGVYKWSFFERLNGTAQGPFSVNRGVKNKSRLGDTTAFHGKRAQKLWHSNECNKVMGTDAITWAPMDKDLDYVYTYEPQICRWMKPNFKREVVVENLIGRRYEVDQEPWQPENVMCYCPLVKKKPDCPPVGLMDLSPCQEAPIYYSEPHFLHGDVALLEYARGLKPNASKHATYITIEPLSGTPLSGSKNLQLNVKLFKSPGVELLANVSEGFFPILWAEEAKEANIESHGKILQTFRVWRLIKYVVHVPLVVGIFIIVRTFFIHLGAGSASKSQEPCMVVRITYTDWPCSNDGTLYNNKSVVRQCFPIKRKILNF